MKMQHQGEVALITGSRRGIGLGIAVCLAREGFNIVMNGTAPGESTAEPVRLVKTEGISVVYIQADISVREDRERLISETKSQFGRLDILVNNAGVNPEVRQDILEATEESFDRLINVNLKGPYFLSQIAAKWMIQQKENNLKAQPKIINISSISAYTASTQRGEYCVSKAGISMMTKLFAARLAEYGIGVYEIRPGIIDTEMTAPVKDRYNRQIAEGLTPIRRWGYPEDIAGAVSAITQGHFPFSTGEVINVDGGFHLKIL